MNFADYVTTLPVDYLDIKKQKTKEMKRQVQLRATAKETTEGKKESIINMN